MGESGCLMQPFSYAAPEGDSLGALRQSVSFGRFLSEKLDWEKRSAFSTQNRYVAEAERYSRPGSVAQKKAFFEAHYKKLAAARKAAAEEALLLQQQQIPKPEPDDQLPVQVDISGGGKNHGLASRLDLESPRGSLDTEIKLPAEKVSRCGNRQPDEKENRGKAEFNGIYTTGEKLVEKTPIIVKKAKDSQPKSSGKPRASKLSLVERTPREKRSKSFSFTTPAKEFNRLVSIIRKIDGSRASSSSSKTPLRTPSNKVSAKESPLSSNTRGKIAPDSSAKRGGGEGWKTPSCFTPFGLRTEERAERRKKKVEDKLKAMEENEESKVVVRQRLCFKAKPLPKFYKERPKSREDQTT